MRFSYRPANNCLLVLILLVNGYIVASPFAPMAISWWQLNHSNVTARLHTKVTQQSAAPQSVKQQPDGLIIPAIGIDAPVIHAEYNQRYRALDKGIWFNPRSAAPGNGGNTVLAGHRFTYKTPQAVFYNLPRLKPSDEIAFIWHKKQYVYQVQQVKVVPASEVSIEAPTTHEQLTLYTCTPLFKPTDRLVIIALPKETV